MSGGCFYWQFKKKKRESELKIQIGSGFSITKKMKNPGNMMCARSLQVAIGRQQQQLVGNYQYLWL